MYISIFLFTGITLIFENCHCIRILKATPGVPTVTFLDAKYVQDVVFTTRRYSRKTDYVVNLEFTLTRSFGNNISVSIILYEYLHNEYRRSFVEFHFSFCNLILKDAIIGAVIRKVGLTICPLPAGRYHLLNMTFDQEFPSVFPFEKGKGELLVKVLPQAKLIAKGDLVLTFKQRTI